MRKSSFKAPIVVLIFNSARVLIAVARSIHSAAEMTHGNLQSISFCCTGRYSRSGAFYYRHLHPDVLVDLDDLDNLQLEEYDKLCGVKREYVPKRRMAQYRKKAADRYQTKMKIANDVIARDKAKSDEE